MNNYTLWDAHAHLQSPLYKPKEIQTILQDCQDNLIAGVINVFCFPTTKAYQEGITLAENYPILHTNFGLQPTDATDENFAIFKANVLQYQKYICAIGEVGLDYYWVKDPALQAKQEEAFRGSIELANELQLPLVIHSRKAEDQCLDLLESLASVPVVMHGMEASEENVKRMINLNYSITIPTSICIRKKYQKIANRTPLELIMLETDAPYQLPFNAPRGKRVKNSPVNIAMSAQKLADIKDLPLEDIATITSRNTQTFFKV